MFAALPAWDGSEGIRPRIVISPGAVAIEAHDLAKLERTRERAVLHDQHAIDQRATWLDDNGEGCAPRAPRSEITEWSRRSRNRMTRTLCELDWTPLYAAGRLILPITLTLPGDWLTVAPNGKAWKRLCRRFEKRWAREWGEPLIGAWKDEYQHRGAPHRMILTAPPYDRLSSDGRPFRQWLSETWADVVAHPDPEQRARHVRAGTSIDWSNGLKMRDPKRVAIYFTKHGLFAAKEYQNHAPGEWSAPGDGPGRFWGVLGLKRCTAPVEISGRDAVTAARVMRRWARAQQTTREVRAPRYVGGRPDTDERVIGLAGAQLVAEHRLKRRKVRRRVRRMRSGRGWLALNDGPAFAADIARYIAA